MRTLAQLVIVSAIIARLASTGAAAPPQIDNETLMGAFMEVYPDLASHQDIVTNAVVSLTATGFSTPTVSGVYRAVAARARKSLQAISSQGTQEDQLVAESFKAREDAARIEAQRLYPQIATPNSPLELRVRSERAELIRSYPIYFKNPDWPLMLTKSCVALMAIEAAEKAAAQQQAQAAPPSMTAEQLKQSIETLQMLQNLKHPHSSSRRSQTLAQALALLQTTSPGRYIGINSEHWIKSVIERGRIIQLEDGSLWQLNPFNKIDAILWLATERIAVIDSENAIYPYKLINSDGRSAAEAKLISK